MREADVRMRSLQVPFLPVVDVDEIVGILTARDIYDEPRAAAKGAEAAAVRDNLSKHVALCYADDDLQMAKEVSDESGHHSLLVVDDQQHLVGWITLEAITAALREHGPRRTLGGEFEAEAAERIVETASRANSDEPGRPKLSAIKIKTRR